LTSFQAFSAIVVVLRFKSLSPDIKEVNQLSSRGGLKYRLFDNRSTS